MLQQMKLYYSCGAKYPKRNLEIERLLFCILIITLLNDAVSSSYVIQILNSEYVRIWKQVAVYSIRLERLRKTTI
jgi:hypothetical protein